MPNGHLDCLAPVKGTTTGESVARQYGKAAVDGDVGGPEGTPLLGLTLYSTDPTHQLDIVWWDDARTAVSMVRASDKSVDWIGPSGLHVGSSLADVEAANGKPFTLSGFGWDYGGYAVDFKGGKLETLDGGCHLLLRFDNVASTAAIPDGISGDGVQLNSDDPKVKKYAPVITEMSVGWPLPKGVKPSGGGAGD